MKRFATVLLVCMCLFVTSAMADTQAMRISQVYGAGGNSGAIYNQDYVELFNMSGEPVDISGWSLQYGSATGSNTTGFGTCTNCTVVMPEGSIVQPCSYFLVALATGTTGIALPTADATGLMALAAANGKVALLSTDIPSGVCPPDASTYVDLVGYGTANCFETAATPAISATLAAFRAQGGALDSDNNSTDFAVAEPAPRNSATAPNEDCTSVATESETWGTFKSMYR